HHVVESAVGPATVHREPTPEVRGDITISLGQLRKLVRVIGHSGIPLVKRLDHLLGLHESKSGLFGNHLGTTTKDTGKVGDLARLVFLGVLEDMIPEGCLSSQEMKVQIVLERIDHGLVTAQGCQNTEFLPLVVHADNRMTLFGNKALTDGVVRRRKRLSRDTSDRHTPSTSLECVDRGVAPTVVVHVVEEAINPCGTPLACLLCLLYSNGKLVVLFHQLIQDCFGHLKLACRSPVLEDNTPVKENLGYLIRGVHILAAKPGCYLGVLLLLLVQFHREILCVLQVKEEPSPIHVCAHLCDLVLEVDELHSRSRNQLTLNTFEPSREDGVHPRIDVVFRMIQVNLFEDLGLGGLVLLGNLGHQTLDVVRQVWVQVMPNQVFQGYTDTTLESISGIDQLGLDLHIESLGPELLHRDAQTPVDNLEIEGKVLTHDLLHGHQGLDRHGDVITT